ncbi:MAG: hypothetical protein NVSMB13_09520 [Mycobacteriales bacterium]
MAEELAFVGEAEEETAAGAGAADVRRAVVVTGAGAGELVNVLGADVAVVVVAAGAGLDDVCEESGAGSTGDAPATVLIWMLSTPSIIPVTARPRTARTCSPSRRHDVLIFDGRSAR